MVAGQAAILAWLAFHRAYLDPPIAGFTLGTLNVTFTHGLDMHPGRGDSRAARGYQCSTISISTAATAPMAIARMTRTARVSMSTPACAGARLAPCSGFLVVREARQDGSRNGPQLGSSHRCVAAHSACSLRHPSHEDRANVSEGASPKNARYICENRPKCQKP
jgi:hypothetical protein